MDSVDTMLLAQKACFSVDANSPVCAFQPAGYFAKGNAISFRIDPRKFNEDFEDVYVYWDHQLEDGATYCEQTTSSNRLVVTFVCPEPGKLTIDLSIFLKDLTERRFVSQVTVLGEVDPELPQDTAPPPMDDDELDGPTLYMQNCAGCHNPLGTSAKKGRSAGQISNAINNNIGGMGSLIFLTPAEIKVIEEALAQ